MKPPRLFLTLVLVAVLTACSNVPTLPPNPFGPTWTPSATLAPTPTPTFTPSPTPIPAVRIASGDRALFNGDYDSARIEYRFAFDQSADAETRAESLWGLARTEFEAGNTQTAIELFNQLVREHPESVRAAQAHYLLGDAYFSQDRFTEAAAEFGAYVSARSGILDAYALERQGDALFSAANYVEALNAYNAASVIPRLDTGLELQIKIGQTRAALGDYANALAQYDSIAQVGNASIRAQMDYLAGSAYKFLGQTTEAQTRFLHAVENYPVSYYSYLSLVELVDAGAPVDDLDRGLVNYFVGNYDKALERLDIYITAGLDTDGAARYYRALTLDALNRNDEALAQFTSFIADFPAHARWPEAWDRKADLQWIELNDHSGAAQTLRNFAAIAPSNPLAIEYLMSAARILERDDQLAEAGGLWETIADQYSGDSRAAESVFLAGIAFYRLGDFHRALADFQRSLLFSTESDSRARALLWIGKTHEKLGDPAKARDSWTQAQGLDSTAYYSIRSRDLLLGRPLFEPASLLDLEVDLASERADAAGWVRLTFSLPATTDLSGPGALASDPRFIRGAELWEMGFYDEARTEFEDLRVAVSADPADTFRLANYLLDLGLYRSGIFAARQVLSLAGLEEQTESLQAAKYFSHVRYGLYYSDLIESSAEKDGLDPLFLFSIMRHESLYESFVGSSAGARGLMQVMPDTGADMASRLGWPLSFEPDMLYRPNVSVRLGSYYMAIAFNLSEGDIYSALAGYNAGPYGESIIWRELAGGDPDLFLEIVRSAETRDYIRGIYEIHNIYRMLYSPVGR